MTFPRMVALAFVASCAAFLAPAARAGCFVPLGTEGPAARLSLGAEDRGGRVFHHDQAGQAVGLWHTLFLTSGGQKYDESFQEIHRDGSEMMVSNGLPPVLGNVCVGVWREDDGRIKMRHVTWNWNPDNSFAGTFVMVARFRVHGSGRTYSGTWSAKNYDADGNPIPSLDAEGTVTARRISVD